MRHTDIKGMLDGTEPLREGTRLELKEATGGLPRDLWETYSAFANTAGGTIVLGVHEDQGTHKFVPVGVSDPTTLVQDFWDGVRNPQRVSADVLMPHGVSVVRDEKGRDFVCIEVPRANRFSLPVEVYVRQRKGFVAYVRRGEADHVATEEELRLFAYDSAREADSHALTEVGIDALNSGTISRYRRIFAARKPSHPWAGEDDLDFLYHLRAVARDQEGELHPTRAGLLAFGNEFEIVGVFPFFFLDYREERGGGVRWEDRVHSASGEWSGNIVDFYLDVMSRLDHAITTPFRVEEGGYGHTTNSEVKDAANEALANALVHAYYGGSSTVKVVLGNGCLVATNSGTLVVDRDVALAGGTSEPRNPALMRIFSHIGRIDHAGSGLNAIWQTCRHAFGREPTLKERFTPYPEVEICMPLAPADDAMGGKTTGTIGDVTLGDDSAPAGATSVTQGHCPKDKPSVTHIERIQRLLRSEGTCSAGAISQAIGLSPSGTRRILAQMVADGIIESSGNRRWRRYALRGQE